MAWPQLVKKKKEPYCKGEKGKKKRRKYIIKVLLLTGEKKERGASEMGEKLAGGGKRRN